MRYDILFRDVILGGKTVSIAISGNRFAAIGELPDAGADKVIECGGKFAATLPFYNTHAHAAMTLFQSFAEDMELFDWLQNHIWPAEAKLTDEDIYIGTRLATVQMIRSGTVYFNDSYWKPDNAYRAVQESGMRATLGKIYLQGVSDNNASCDLLASGGCSRITVSHAPHAIYTVNETQFRNIARMMESDDLQLHVHVAETAKEVADCRKEHNGMTPVEYLDSLGLINSRAVLAHCVHLSDHDREIIASRGAVIAHNPVSNIKLCSGLFNFERAKAAGCKVALGTDSSASNNDLSMLEEMKFAALTAKMSAQSPTAGKVQDIFDMATSAGAAVAQVSGKIAVGCEADMLLIDLTHPLFAAGHDLTADLVYAAVPEVIDSVLCDGKFLMEKRVIPGESDIVAQGSEVCRKIRCR